MKILIVHPHLTFLGGAELVVVKLSEYLLRKGIDNSILTLSLSKEIAAGNPNLNFIIPEIQYKCVIKSTNINNAAYVITETRALSLLIKKHGNGFDLVNLHNFPSTWAFVFSGIKKPAVWYCNELPGIWHNVNPSKTLKLVYLLGQLLDRKIVKSNISRICCADEINKLRIVRNYSKEPAIVPYGIDYEFFDSCQESVNLFNGLDLKGKFIISQVGLISPQKNQKECVEMLNILSKSMQDVILVFAGRVIDQKYSFELKELIKKYGLENKVIFMGDIPRAQVASLYKVSNIAVFPVKIQGGWLSPFEAICCGKPVIVSTTMGASSLIRENNLGLVSDDFAGSVFTIRDNFGFYQQKAKDAASWVKENLSWNLFAGRMNQVFINNAKEWRNM